MPWLVAYADDQRKIDGRDRVVASTVENSGPSSGIVLGVLQAGATTKSTPAVPAAVLAHSGSLPA